MANRGPVRHKRSFLRRVLRIVGRVFLTVLVVLIIVFFLVQTPFVQNIAREKAESYLSRKLWTRVRIVGLAMGLLRSVRLKDLYLADKHSDTLLSAGLIDVRVRMLALLQHHLDIGIVHLKDLTARVSRE